jgi:hypothetical protein
MDEYKNPEKVAETGKDQLRAVADNFKEAASAKAEDIRQAAGQKADQVRSARGPVGERGGSHLHDQQFIWCSLYR